MWCTGPIWYFGKYIKFVIYFIVTSSRWHWDRYQDVVYWSKYNILANILSLLSVVCNRLSVTLRLLSKCWRRETEQRIRLTAIIIHWSVTFNQWTTSQMNLKWVGLNGPRREKTCLQEFGNNKGVDQLAHPHSLISALVIRFLESTISKLVTSEISIF